MHAHACAPAPKHPNISGLDMACAVGMHASHGSVGASWPRTPHAHFACRHAQARVPTGGCARMHSRVPAFACACACGAKCARVCVYRKHRARDCLRRQTRNTPAEASPCYLPAHAQPLLARSSNPRAPPQPARRLRTSSAGTIHTCARNVEHLPLAWRHNLHPLVPAAAHWRPGRQQRRPKQCRGSAHDEASANSITVRGAMFGL